jgi:hypothetical protein
MADRASPTVSGPTGNPCGPAHAAAMLAPNEAAHVHSHPPFGVQGGEGIVLETPTGDTAHHQGGNKADKRLADPEQARHRPQAGSGGCKHHNDDDLLFILEGEFRSKAGDSVASGPETVRRWQRVTRPRSAGLER